MWFIGVEVEQETSAPRPKKNLGSAPAPFSKVAIFTNPQTVVLQIRSVTIIHGEKKINRTV